MYGIMRVASRGRDDAPSFWTIQKKTRPVSNTGRVLHVDLFRLREHRRWCLLLLRQTYLGRLAVVPLEGQVRGAHTELPGGDLLEVVVPGPDPELHGVERILEPNRDAHVVAIELLPDRDVGHLHRRESTLLDFHRRAVEVVRLEYHRRIHLRRGVEAVRPRHGVR